MSKIILNIVEPGTPPSPTPIDPGTDLVVPNTGLFTHGIGGPEATIITISIVAIVAIVAAAVLYYKKKHSKADKTNKAFKLAETISAVKVKKKVSIQLAVLAMIVLLGALAAILVNADESNTNAAEGGLTVTTTGEEKTIEVGDSPVFAIAEVEVTVAEETQAGYTLTAFTEDTDLVSTTDDTKIIPMVAADEGELVALAEDTYGLSLTKPASQDDEVFTALSTDADAPIFITDKDYEATEANDKTTIYYGFYITPDVLKGTYEGSEINYAAEANRTDPATVTFDSNGLSFDGGKTTNVMRYGKAVTDKTELYSHTPNVNDAGEQTPGEMYPIGLNKTFVYEFADATEVKLHLVKMEADATCSPNTDQYFSFWQGSHPDYTAVNNWESGEKVSGSNGKYIFSIGSQYAGMDATVQGNTITFAYTTSDHRGGHCVSSGYGYYAIITATDADGNPAYAMGNVPYSGTYATPATTEYVNYEFLGWSLDPNATSADYTDAADIETNMLLSAGEKVTLYAVWSPIVDISYDGNNATAGSMVSTSYDGDTPTTVTLAHEDVIAGDNIDLYAPNYKKTGYGFVGWSTDQNAWEDLTDDDESNDPVIYGPNQSFTMTKEMALAETDGKSTLYAVWVPAEQNNGTPVALQGWQGCSTLTSTTYNTETGQLTVGKNTITALTDNRDGEVYTVARLADGNCWMTENLRLDNEATISTTNTNNPRTVDGNVAIKNNDGNTSAHLSPNNNRWCTGWDSAECYDQSYLNTFNTNLGGEGAIASYNGSYDDNKAFQWQSYGNSYCWYSATAGNGTYSTGEQGAETVAGDICPVGWMLPIGNETTENGSFSNLDSTMGGPGSYQNSSSASNKWRSFPNNFVYSGYWGTWSAAGRGNYGHYWSSTAHNTNRAYDLVFDSGYVDPGANVAVKKSGPSVRCVAPVE